MNTITVPGLIHRFEDRVHQLERYQFGEPTGKEPYSPMIVSFLGQEAIEGYRDVATHLLNMWPSYQNEFLFLGVTEGAKGVEFTELRLVGTDVAVETIAAEEIGNRVSSLFGLKSHFQDRSRLFIFNVMDTTRFSSAADFEHWTCIMQTVRNSFIDRSIDTLDMLIVLLNENIGERQTTSAKIKNVLYNNRAAYHFSTLLLSNRRSDHTILEDWDSCYRVIANTIALTNNSETQIAGVLFEKGVYTAAYACEEKPVSKIGQTVIKKLIERLSKESFGTSGNLFNDRQTLAKLGVSQDRTIELLDSYAEQNLFKMLPSAEQLQLFPRKQCQDYDDLSALSEKDFNLLTMNCWDSFLNQITERARENVQRDSNIRANWKSLYSKKVSSEFSINDLIWLKDHIVDVRKNLSSARLPSQEVQVLSAAKSQLKYMLSSNVELISIFVETIQELGSEAEIFLKEWNELLRSGLSVHAIRDENITQFYNRKAQNFFDHNGTEISEAFRKITDAEALKAYLFGLIDRMIESDSVFSAPFEEELESRLQEEALPINAKQYIRQKLTGENVPVYYQAQFNVGTPIASCILIKIGTQLYSNLVNHLSNTTYYYDTGSGNSAEALNYYVVSSDNLVSEEI